MLVLAVKVAVAVAVAVALALALAVAVALVLVVVEVLLLSSPHLFLTNFARLCRLRVGIRFCVHDGANFLLKPVHHSCKLYFGTFV